MEKSNTQEPPALLDDSESPRLLKPIARMTIGLWGANFLLVTASGMASGLEHQVLRGSLRLGLTVFGIGLCVGMHRLIMLMPPRPFVRRGLLTFVLSFFAALIHLFANEAVLRLNGIATSFSLDQATLTIIVYGFWAWFFLAWAALHLAIDYSDQVQRQARAHTRISIAAREAQIRALRYQINPHFLFNTLNSLSTLVLDRRNDEAQQMIDRLSSFLRTALEDNSVDRTTLAAEIQNQRRYLEIEQTRHRDLTSEFDIAPGLDRAMLPCFLLQPLIENAVKYGPRGGHQEARIRITARAWGDQLELAVVNDVGAARASGTGIGLANVRERLRMHYGESFSLAAGPAPDNTFDVRIRIPLLLATPAS